MTIKEKIKKAIDSLKKHNYTDEEIEKILVFSFGAEAVGKVKLSDGLFEPLEAENE